jgi:cardiolipin synthase A/B
MLAVLSVIGIVWPRVIAWPLAALGGWLSLNLGIRGWRQLKGRRRKPRGPRDGDRGT